MIPKVYTAEELYSFFPHSLADIEKTAQDMLDETTQSLESLYHISERTFENTIYAYDFLVSKFNMISALLYAVEAVYPDETMRHAAHHNLLKLHSYGVDNLWQNEKLYAVLKGFQESTTYKELADSQKYFVDEHVKTYERNGVHLSCEIRARLKDIHKELGEHTLSFDRNIAADVRSIKVEREAMKGLSDDFIAGLRREGELYVLAVDYPTYYEVMENCSVESTRAALWHEFVNRAYPENEEELAQIIALRDELAQLVGYKSFAQYDISSQMAKDPISVELFLEDLIQRSHAKVEKEITLLKEHLPAGVTLTAEGTYKPWDLMYTKAAYKKQFLAVNESHIAEYFPLEHTLSSLLSIYEQFLGVTFKKSHFNSIWHEHVEYITVYKDGKFIGSLLMDLFPRPGKYTHACHITLVPTCTRKDDFYPALSLVIANFPWPRAGHPALLPIRWNECQR
jgi:thimet oligopeptidase